MIDEHSNIHKMIPALPKTLSVFPGSEKVPGGIVWHASRHSQRCHESKWISSKTIEQTKKREVEQVYSQPTEIVYQSEKFLDLGTLTWRGADVWVQWFLHAVLRDFEVGKSWSYSGLDNQSAGVARWILFLMRHLSKFPLFKNENPPCRFWDMALGIFCCCIWKENLPLYTRIRWRHSGMGRCGA